VQCRQGPRPGRREASSGNVIYFYDK
jgi:hypothetical protein